MKPIGWGLAAALLTAVLAPVAVMSAPKDKPAATEAMHTQGMTEAPPLLQAAGVSCPVSDARFIGKAADPKTKVTTSYYEVACGQSMGYVIKSDQGQTPTVYTCVDVAPKPGEQPGQLSCTLPGNSDPKAQLAPLLSKAGIQCTPKAARGLGQNKDNSFIEVACQEGPGYVLIASAPFDAAKPAQAQNCLNFDDSAGAVKCELSDKASRLAIVDTLAKSGNANCAIKDRRFIGTTQDGSDFYEASCQDGKGYMFKSSGGRLSQSYTCGQAANILGGCTLTDSRQASAEQAALYTKLAHNSGSNCDVDKYAVFPSQGSTEAVELACKGGTGAVGLFPATGKGQVVECGRAIALGYKCSLSADNGYAALTADLRKANPKSTCTVSNSAPLGKTTQGTMMIEVACSDHFKGYILEYNTTPTLNILKATGCAFAAGCKLPGNV